MGVIQNSINQALGAAGIAARLSPEPERKQEIRKLTKQEKQLNEAIVQLQEHATVPKGISQKEAAELETEQADILFPKLAEVQSRKAELGAGNFEDVFKTKSAHRTYHELDATEPSFEEKEKIKTKQALEKAKGIMAMKREQNERIQLFGAHGDVISDFAVTEKKKFPGELKKKPQGGNK